MSGGSIALLSYIAGALVFAGYAMTRPTSDRPPGTLFVSVIVIAATWPLSVLFAIAVRLLGSERRMRITRKMRDQLDEDRKRLDGDRTAR